MTIRARPNVADVGADAQLGVTDRRFKNWFEPFGGGADRDQRVGTDLAVATELGR